MSRLHLHVIPFTHIPILLVAVALLCATMTSSTQTSTATPAQTKHDGRTANTTLTFQTSAAPDTVVLPKVDVAGPATVNPDTTSNVTSSSTAETNQASNQITAQPTTPATSHPTAMSQDVNQAVSCTTLCNPAAPVAAAPVVPACGTCNQMPATGSGPRLQHVCPLYCTPLP